MRRDSRGKVPYRRHGEMTERMSCRARAERGVVGRLFLLLLLALGLMHLLAHAGDTGIGHERETVAHAHAVQSEPTTPGEAIPLVATASVEQDHHGTEGRTDLGLCAAVIGCCALLAVGGRRLRGRRIALLPLHRRRRRAARSGLFRPPDPCLSRGVGSAQPAVLRI
ncbi:hypothetical protein [Streptomyces sp. NPDC001388]|uniref:hypothetical protein n=1 Tax=Streptomyces sp. NPDC001388 TaxID=3364568 RepID=UPI00368414F3